MSSGLVDKVNGNSHPNLQFELEEWNFDIIRIFRQFPAKKRDIYDGTEKIEFDHCHPVFKTILIKEFI